MSQIYIHVIIRSIVFLIYINILACQEWQTHIKQNIFVYTQIVIAKSRKISTDKAIKLSNTSLSIINTGTSF